MLSISIVSFAQEKNVDQKVENLLKQMTLKEKIGQLNQNSYFGLSAADIDKMPDVGLDEKLRDIKLPQDQISKMTKSEKALYLTNL